MIASTTPTHHAVALNSQELALVNMALRSMAHRWDTEKGRGPAVADEVRALVDNLTEQWCHEADEARQLTAELELARAAGMTDRRRSFPWRRNRP